MATCCDENNQPRCGQVIVPVKIGSPDGVKQNVLIQKEAVLHGQLFFWSASR